MKKLLFLPVLFCWLSACTKEGLSGPQGPVGPAGPPGLNEGGGSGSPLRVISFLTPASASFSWEQQTATATNTYWRMRWANGRLNGAAFLLPDSLTTMIDNGSLLVYAGIRGQTGFPNYWQQLMLTPAGFRDVETYTYELQKVNNRYSISILGELFLRRPQDTRTPQSWDMFKFIIIPQTEAHPLEWEE
ncbi:MAG: hypothetical protein P0Y53_13125 [Candidatus Pseudobacter hemicellulosilyticus]|uniref:Collagen-like protein n=1 Tax=Candidatus Pseudobacter hemicellulosilyticus TaxID=3121375 RepID=A0AAJ6BEN9_9BACT|nr:MAG: hypothetical protein P0Y53_13125 [Pseudobacter sp.]